MARFLSISILCSVLSVFLGAFYGASVAEANEAELLSGALVPLTKPAEQEMVVCQGLDGDVVFEILMDKSKAKPHALAMRVSDPTVSPVYEEIALFDVQDRQLTSEVGGSAASPVVRVVGLVDLKNPLTGRKGERVGGTVLGALHSITVDLDIDFDQVSTPRKRHAGLVTYLKKNGEDLTQDLDCRRQK